MNHTFDRLDDGKATLRILYQFNIGAHLASRGQLEAELGKMGVGRTAFYSSIDVLLELGLIVEERRRVDGKNLLFTKLTEKGEKISEAIDELYTATENLSG